MMNVTVMSVIMIAIIVISVFMKKIPMQFTLCVVPVICALCLGYNISEVSDFALKQCSKSMNAAGYMVLFAMLYFTMLSESGMFHILVGKFVKIFKGNINIWVIMIMTSLIAAIGMLTSAVTTAYLIVFPIMMPFYEKMKFDKKSAMIIAQTSIAAMCFVPWGIAVVNSSVFAGVDAMELSRRLIPVSLCYIPAIILQWAYFGLRHKKQGGLMNTTWESSSESTNESSFSRPKLFLPNLIVFVAVVIALATNLAPSYLVFIFAAFITILVDYPNPKDYQALWAKVSKSFFNTLITLIGISVFIGIFQSTGMVEAFATLLVSLFPTMLSRYLHILLALIMIIVIRFMPNKIYNSTYPVLISVGESFGLRGTDVIAPFVTNMSLATGSSPFTAATHVGTGILGINTEEYCNESMKVQTVTNAVIILTALLTGVLF